MLKHILSAIIAGTVAGLLCLPVLSQPPGTPVAPLPKGPELKTPKFKGPQIVKGQHPPELGGPDVPRFSPWDALVLAWADAEAVAIAHDPEVPIEYVRYLSSHNLNKADRIRHKQTVDFTVNSLSIKRTIVRTAGLPNNVIDPLVIRVNLKDYGITPKAWDSLVENGSGDVPLPEPYFHKPIIVANEVDEYEDEVVTRTTYKTEWVDNGYGQRVQQRVPVTKKVKTGKKVRTGRKLKADEKTKVLAAGSWLAYKDAGQTISKLVAATRTKNPLARSDWFITYAWWAPQYYVMLGLDPVKGTVRDWFELVNFDEKRGERSRIASIADTKIVTQHNRILHRYVTQNGYVSGYVWETFDTENGIENEYYLNAIGNFDKPEFAAQELIGTLLNTLQAYALADNKAKLLNLAKANIALHSDVEPTKLVDKQVYAGRNCVFCHKEGIYPIKDKVRNLAQREIAMLISQGSGNKKVDEATSDKIKDAFQPAVVGVVSHDQAIYTMAVNACNGLAPGVNAAQLETITWTYHDGPITMERAAWDVGWPVEKLDAALRIGVNIDPTLTQMLQKPPELPAIQVWEAQGYHALQDYIIGLEVLAAQKNTTLDKLLEPHIKK